MNLTPKIINESDVDAALDAEIKQKLCICFPWHKRYYKLMRPWHAITPLYNVVIQQNNSVIAHAAIVDKTITVADQSIRVAGVQNVFVIPEFRKQGISDRLLAAAMTEAKKRNFDMGMLFTSYIPVLKVYERNGWIEIQNDFVKLVKGKKIPFPPHKHKFFFPLKVNSFPQGTVQLPSNDW